MLPNSHISGELFCRASAGSRNPWMRSPARSAQRSNQTPGRRARPTTRGRAAVPPKLYFSAVPCCLSVHDTCTAASLKAPDYSVHVQLHLAAPGERRKQPQQQLLHAHAPRLLQGVPGVCTPAAQGPPNGDPTAPCGHCCCHKWIPIHLQSFGGVKIDMVMVPRSALKSHAHCYSSRRRPATGR